MYYITTELPVFWVNLPLFLTNLSMYCITAKLLIFLTNLLVFWTNLPMYYITAKLPAYNFAENASNTLVIFWIKKKKLNKSNNNYVKLIIQAFLSSSSLFPYRSHNALLKMRLLSLLFMTSRKLETAKLLYKVPYFSYSILGCGGCYSVPGRF